MTEDVNRRRYVRQRLDSLAYVELGKDNGGIVLNVGEGGLAVAAATPMSGDAIPQIRFRLPGSAAWIHTGAQIVWIGESKKEAGLYFVDLAQADRRRIREWISASDLELEATPSPRISGQPAPQIQVAAPPPVLQANAEPAIESGRALDVEPEPQAETAPGISAETEPEIPIETALPSLPWRPPVQTPRSAAQAAAQSVARSIAARSAADRAAAAQPPVTRLAEPPTADRATAAPDAALAMSDRAPAAPDPGPAVVPVLPQAQANPPSVPPSAESVTPLAAPPPSTAVRRLGSSLLGPSIFGTGETSADVPEAQNTIPQGSRHSGWAATAILVCAVALLSFLVGMATGRDAWANWLVRLIGQESANQTSNSVASTAGNPVGDTLSQLNQPPAGQPPQLSQSPVQQASQVAGSESQSAQNPTSPVPNLGGDVAQRADGDATTVQSPRSLAPTPDPAQGGSFARSEQPASAALRPFQPEELPTGPRTNSASNQVEREVQTPAFPPAAPAAQLPPTVSQSAPAVPAAAAVPPASQPAGRAAAPTQPSPIPTFTASSGGSVEVVTNPYPSIRVPPAVRSSRSETSLRLGALINRVDPVYPPEALGTGIEGVVQLHILIGTDGTVMDMEVVRGPQPLIQVVRDAVGRWRYQPTYLGTEAVETESDVTVTFRLANSASK